MNVLIVDDEQPVRSCIRLLTDWAAYGVTQVFEAESVAQAKACICRSTPELVFTDIRMPQHDGLELMQWIHEAHPQTQIIVISAYNEFEYAITAMRMGALDYLLKPIQPIQLECVLRKASKLLQQQQEAENQSRFQPDTNERIALALYIEGDSEFPTQSSFSQVLSSPTGLMVLNLFCVHTVQFSSHAAKKHLLSALRELLEPEGRGLVLWGINDQNLVYLLLYGTQEQQTQTADLALELLADKAGIKLLSSLQCNGVWSCAELPALAAQLIHSIGQQPILEHPGGGELQPPGFPDTYFSAIAQGSISGAQEIIYPYLSQLQSAGCLTMSDLQRWWHALCDAASSFLQAHPDAEHTHPAFIATQALLPILNDHLRLQPDLLLEFLQEQAQNLSSNFGIRQVESADLCAQIKKEICTHYAEQISLSTLAAKYYRNPSYLSRIFKERYNISIMNFIAETRVEQAKILLKTTDFRISRIAHAVGYADEKYFCRVFKQISGLSPAGYRNL